MPSGLSDVVPPPTHTHIIIWTPFVLGEAMTQHIPSSYNQARTQNMTHQLLEMLSITPPASQTLLSLLMLLCNSLVLLFISFNSPCFSACALSCCKTSLVDPASSCCLDCCASWSSWCRQSDTLLEHSFCFLITLPASSSAASMLLAYKLIF